MNLALWIAAGLLAFVAFAGGVLKTFVPVEKLAKQPGGKWVGKSGVWFVKMMGGLEILAAAGLILPAVLNIAPILVPVTAVCWMLLMLCAMITHFGPLSIDWTHGIEKITQHNRTFVRIEWV